MNDKSPGIWASFSYLPRFISRDLDCKGSGGNLNNADRGCRCWIAHYVIAAALRAVVHVIFLTVVKSRLSLLICALLFVSLVQTLLGPAGEWLLRLSVCSWTLQKMHRQHSPCTLLYFCFIPALSHLLCLKKFVCTSTSAFNLSRFAWCLQSSCNFLG